jgi:ABC-2 type transport system permease protein
MNKQKQILCIMRREFWYMWRDRSLRNVMLFVPLLGVLLFAWLYSAQSLNAIPTAIVDLDHSRGSREFADKLTGAEKLNITAYLSTYQELQEAIAGGRIVVGVVIPKNFEQDVALGRQTRVLMIIDGSNMVYATNASAALLEVTRTVSAEAGIRTLVGSGMQLDQAREAYKPIAFREEAWFNPTMNYAYFLVLALILNIWQQCCTLASAMNVIGETGMKSWLQIKASGVSMTRLFISKSMTHIITFMLMVLPLYFLAFRVLKLPLQCNFGVLMFFTLLFVIAIHSVGTLMSSAVSNAVDASRLGMMIALPSFVLSGYTWPIDAMPPLLQSLVWIFPQTWFFQGLNYLTFKNPGGDFMLPFYAGLIVTAAVCYAISIMLQMWREKLQ